MQKQNTISAILTDYELDFDLTLVKVCKNHSIDIKSFYRWLKDFPILASQHVDIKKAHNQNYKSEVKQTARTALLERIKGKHYKEVTNEYETKRDLDADGNEIEKIRRTHKKTVNKFLAPDVAAIRYGLNNTDSENFKDRQTTTHEGEVSTTNASTDQLSFEELYALKYGKMPPANLYDAPDEPPKADDKKPESKAIHGPEAWKDE